MWIEIKSISHVIPVTFFSYPLYFHYVALSRCAIGKAQLFTANLIVTYHSQNILCRPPAFPFSFLKGKTPVCTFVLELNHHVWLDRLNDVYFISTLLWLTWKLTISLCTDILLSSGILSFKKLLYEVKNASSMKKTFLFHLILASFSHFAVSIFPSDFDTFLFFLPTM